METLDCIGSATYSPDDNKLRLNPVSRLSASDYARVKDAGFAWAPQQKLFVASWTPNREDLLLELAGEIGDEDTSLVERAEVRAERFEGYSENRMNDAENAKAGVARIADGIPFGQPILVGHHSERHARKDAEKIENGMRKAVKMWETSKYWEDRARGSLRHAKYKERPDVRARRIKTIEADKRKQERYIAEYKPVARFWRGETKLIHRETKETMDFPVTYENALKYMGHMTSVSMSRDYPLAEFPRTAPASQYEGTRSLWSALGSGDGLEFAIITLDQAKEIALEACAQIEEKCKRWITHYDNRLAYEKAMMEESGGMATDQTKPEAGGACLCWLSRNKCDWIAIAKVNKVSVTLTRRYEYGPKGEAGGSFRTTTMPLDKIQSIMSKAQVDALRLEGRLYNEDLAGFVYSPETPASDENKREAPKENDSDFKSMKESLRQGVKVVTANQLFLTPKAVCDVISRMVGIKNDAARILEPSAGTGNLIRAVCDSPAGFFNRRVTAVEINRSLVDGLEILREKILYATESNFMIIRGDFLDQTSEELGVFDLIVMNPPFENGADIKHIQHAKKFLKPGGKLVAVCAAGPRQREAFESVVDEWFDLPEGSFKEQGTMVNTAVISITN